jgi:ribosomal protein L11 methyltransferase
MDLYHAYNIKSTDEVIIGLLSQFDFEAFEENEDHIIAYIKSQDLSETLRIEIDQILIKFGVEFSLNQMADKNWNEIWESEFQPVIVDKFCQVRADFHPAVSGIKYDLVINPKMAFGTGHHATTYMMMASMESIDFQGIDVFDFGCGTGILAILASKLGADKIDAVDIEQESFLNTIENSSINDVNNIVAYCGDLADVPLKEYQVILANINRNILLKYAVDLSTRIASGGLILLSGILIDDEEIVIDAFEKSGIHHQKTLEREGWKCIQFLKM